MWNCSTSVFLGTLCLAVLLGDEVIVPKGNTTLRAGDHVVIFAKNEAIDAVEKLLLP